MAARGTPEAALNAFARFVAYEVGPLDINVNVVAAGFAGTEGCADMPQEFQRRFAQRTPPGRVAEAEDVAPVIAMPVGEGAGFVTAAVLTIGGGHSVARM
jgi:3-oxoacyl-[acyl-carrier protein] reductase